MNVNVAYFPPDDSDLSNTELLLCDDCSERARTPGPLVVRFLDDDDQRGLLARLLASPEGLRQSCGDHRHALCEHLEADCVEAGTLRAGE